MFGVIIVMPNDWVAPVQLKIFDQFVKVVIWQRKLSA